jgi:hypothetical protein
MAEILALRRTSTTGRRERVGGGEVADLVRRHGLVGLVAPASQHVVEPDGVGQRILPVLPELRPLLPGRGLRRGSTVAVQGSTSLLLALLASASEAGSWCAVVGCPALGLAAAAEAGIVLERLALVPDPGPDWPAVVAALLDGIDLVVTAPPGTVSAGLASRLAARARQRGSVLVPYGPWSGADVVLEATGSEWWGLGEGWGRLSRRKLMVSSRGRGAAALPRTAALWYPRRPVEEEPAVRVLEPVGLEAVG